MFKKIGTIALSAAIALLGLQASPAQAANVASGDSISSQSASFNYTLTSAPFSVPAGASYVSVRKSWNVKLADLQANAGKKFEIVGSLTKPDGSVTVIEPASMNSGLLSVNINLNTPTGGVRNDYSSNSVTIPASDVSGGSASVSMYLGGMNMDGTRTPVAAGNYTFTASIKVDGVVATDGAVWGDSWYVNESAYTISLDGSSILAPAGASNGSFNGEACIDSTKIVAGDVVTAKTYLDGVLKNAGMVNWDWRTYVQGSWRNVPSPSPYSTTVAAGDVENGIAVNFNFGSSVVPGNTYVSTVELVNQNGIDVSGSCAPAAPAKPTLTATGSSLTASFQLPAFGDMMASDCQLFDAAAPTVVLASKNNNYPQMGTNVSCTFSAGLVSGHSYFVKARGGYGSIDGPWSEASNTVLKAASGFTLTNPVSGLNQGGKVSLLSVDIAGDADASPIITGNDGANGLLVLASNANPDPMAAGAIDSFNLRHITKDGVDATFAGTGAVSIESGAGGIATNGRLGWFGARNNWVVTYANYPNEMNAFPQVKIVKGTWGAAASTTTTVSSATLTSACSTAFGAGYSAMVNGGMMSPPFVSLSPISAPTETPLFNLTCNKMYQISGTGMTLNMNLLVTIQDATTVTVVKALATPGDTVNAMSVLGTSVNPAAGANDAAVTLFVRTALQTGMSTVTYASREIVTIKKDLTVSTLTSTWAPVALEPTLRVSALNDGTIWGTITEGPSISLLKLAGDNLTTKAVNLDVVEAFATTSITLPNGIQAGNAPLLTVIRQNTMSTVAASATIDTATGAMSTSEAVQYSLSSGNGVVGSFAVDSKNLYWFMTNAASGTKYSVYRWRDPAYVAVVAADQTITWTTSPATMAAGGTTTVAATASSNLAVSYSSTDVTKCTVNASTGVVTAVATSGTCTIKANQAGNDAFKAAPQKVLAITIAAVVVVKKAPKAPTVATKLKIGKTLTVALHATKGTASKGANADGLPAVVTVAAASKAICSVAKVIKSKKITGYTVKGLKAGKCSVVVTITGSATFNALTKTTVVTVAK